MVDGNMKNRRDVCRAKDAGYIEFLGLPGITLILTNIYPSDSHLHVYLSLYLHVYSESSNTLPATLH